MARRRQWQRHPVEHVRRSSWATMPLSLQWKPLPPQTADRHPTDLAVLLRGARLVTAQETEEGRRWAESKIKALTGGDPITARFMRQDFFTFMPQFKLFIAGNHKPGLRNVDEAIRRRLNLIPFVVRIPPKERDPRAWPRNLKAEWGGILQWAIDGCLDWQSKAPRSAARCRHHRHRRLPRGGGCHRPMDHRMLHRQRPDHRRLQLIKRDLSHYNRSAFRIAWQELG